MRIGIRCLILVLLVCSFVSARDEDPDPAYKNRIEYPAEPFQSWTSPPYVKFTIITKDGYDPNIVYYQDCRKYEYHYDFALASLEPFIGMSIEEFDEVTLHEAGQQAALGAVILLGHRYGRYGKGGEVYAHPPSSIPFLSLGAWVLTVGWFGFNVMSAQTLDAVSGLVAVNSLMAMVGGILASLFVGKNDPGFLHNGPLAGLVAVCAGSDLMHPMGALITGAVAGGLFVWFFTMTQNRWKIDDVLGVWPLHGLCGAWGGIAAGIFGSEALGGMGGVSLGAQAVGTLMGIAVALIGGFLVYGVLKSVMGIRLTDEEEYYGADLSIHKIASETDG